MALVQAWPQVAVVGGGAVGCYYGGLLARAGAPVTLIGRAQHVDAISRNGLDFEALTFREHVPMQASTDMAAARGARLVLFCVKSTDTDAVARELAAHLDPSAWVVGLQNGVDNLERLRAVLPNPVVPAVVYVACAMAGAGHLKHTGRGDLVIGAAGNAGGNAASPATGGTFADGLQQIAGWFEAAGVPCVVSDNVMGELWAKLLINCAYNPISALGRARYRRVTALPDARVVMEAAVREVLAVAEREGVRMPPGDWVAKALALSASMPEATSSTAQDLARGKRTEIDHLNGYVARRGAALGVPTPVNQTLHALIKLAEDGLA